MEEEPSLPLRNKGDKAPKLPGMFVLARERELHSGYDFRTESTVNKDSFIMVLEEVLGVSEYPTWRILTQDGLVGMVQWGGGYRKQYYSRPYEPFWWVFAEMPTTDVGAK